MARPAVLPPDKKAELVLRVLAGDLSVSQAAREAGVTEQAIGNWKRQFIVSGSQGLGGCDRQSLERERELRSQITELKTALGEVYLQLRARRQTVDYHALPTQPLRPYGATADSASRGSAASSGYRGVPTRGGV